MLLSLAGIAGCVVFYLVKVGPESAILQFKNARQAMVGFVAMFTGSSFAQICFGLAIKKALLKSEQDSNSHNC